MQFQSQSPLGLCNFRTSSTDLYPHSHLSLFLCLLRHCFWAANLLAVTAALSILISSTIYGRWQHGLLRIRHSRWVVPRPTPWPTREKYHAETAGYALSKSDLHAVKSTANRCVPTDSSSRPQLITRRSEVQVLSPQPSWVAKIDTLTWNPWEIRGFSVFMPCFFKACFIDTQGHFRASGRTWTRFSVDSACFMAGFTLLDTFYCSSFLKNLKLFIEEVGIILWRWGQKALFIGMPTK